MYFELVLVNTAERRVIAFQTERYALVIAARDSGGRPWATLLFGPEGFGEGLVDGGGWWRFEVRAALAS